MCYSHVLVKLCPPLFPVFYGICCVRALPPPCGRALRWLVATDDGFAVGEKDPPSFAEAKEKCTTTRKGGLAEVRLSMEEVRWRC